MAIDTAIERRMAATMPTPFGVPASPDGTISASDRRQAYGIFFHELIATTIEAILNSLLKEDINIAAIVSTRVYPNIILQGAAMPALTYQQISGLRDEVMDSPTGLVNSRFQINCWSDTYSETRDLANAVRIRFDGLSGIFNGLKIAAILAIDESEIPQFPAGEDVIKRYGKRIDYNIWFEE